MQPQRRLVGEFDRERSPNHREAEDENHEDNRAVANVVAAEAEPAGGTAIDDAQEAVEQRPPAAAGTATTKTPKNNAGDRDVAGAGPGNVGSVSGGAGPVQYGPL